MWEMMYETFWDKLEHFCYKLCRDDARAEDLAQEVFLKALQNRSLIDGFTPGQCKAWLFAAARNLYCDQVRRAVKEEALLDPLDHALFTLRYAEGYNATELGEKFSLPPGTVRTRLAKVRTLLKTKLLEE